MCPPRPGWALELPCPLTVSSESHTSRHPPSPHPPSAVSIRLAVAACSRRCRCIPLCVPIVTTRCVFPAPPRTHRLCQPPPAPAHMHSPRNEMSPPASHADRPRTAAVHGGLLKAHTHTHTERERESTSAACCRIPLVCMVSVMMHAHARFLAFRAHDFAAWSRALACFINSRGESIASFWRDPFWELLGRSSHIKFGRVCWFWQSRRFGH